MKEIVNKISSLKSANVACLFLVVSLCGCTDPSKIAKEQNTVQGNNEGGEDAPQKQVMPAAEPKDPAKNDGKKSIIGKTTAVVVNAKEALKNPDIEVVDGKIKGVDPFSQAGSAYVVMASKASTFGMQQAIKTHKVLNDKFPSYDEYMKMMKENRVEFAQLPPYKLYGYDAETGNIMVLQDNKKKAELYKEAGIPLD